MPSNVRTALLLFHVFFVGKRCPFGYRKIAGAMQKESPCKDAEESHKADYCDNAAAIDGDIV
jgi:hypothetical protein